MLLSVCTCSRGCAAAQFRGSYVHEGLDMEDAIASLANQSAIHCWRAAEASSVLFGCLLCVLELNL